MKPIRVKTNAVFTRFVNLDIVRIGNETGPKKLYEGRLKSNGVCGNLATVLPPLLDALFDDFPGSGGVRTVKLRWKMLK